MWSQGTNPIRDGLWVEKEEPTFFYFETSLHDIQKIVKIMTSSSEWLVRGLLKVFQVVVGVGHSVRFSRRRRSSKSLLNSPLLVLPLLLGRASLGGRKGRCPKSLWDLNLKSHLKLNNVLRSNVILFSIS